MKMVTTCIIFQVLILFLIVEASSFNYKTVPPSKFVKHFLGSKKGDTVEGLEQVRKYLFKYGYLGPSYTYGHDSNVFDHDLEKGIEKFQLFFNLNVSGILDRKTLSIMINGTPIKPGAKLVSDPFNRSYYTFTRRWSKYNLTWYPSRFNELLPLTSAFKRWQDVSVFNFKLASSFDTADVKISFHSGEHGDEYPFVKGKGMLAHSFPPPLGVLHFNEDIPWTYTYERVKVDFEGVAVHEIGHILGLGHSSDESAIMYAYSVPRGEIKRDLEADDIAGIRALYSN